MGRLFDCQVALPTWGVKAKFRRAKIGLMRKSSTIYIAILYNRNEMIKFEVNPQQMELLPAAIRLKSLQKDIFVRAAADDQRYATMLREIKVLLKRDKLTQSSKADALDRFISSIPTLASYNSRDLFPSKLSQSFVFARKDDLHLDSGRVMQMQQLQSATSAQPQNVLLADLPMGEDNDDAFDLIADHTKCGHPPVPKEFSHRSSVTECPRLDHRELKRIKIIGLDLLPRELWLQSNLHELTLTGCNLTSIPKQLESFSKTLNFLDLSKNRIDIVPRSFCCKMNQLLAINLSDNLIRTLPIEIKFLRRLIDLNISNNNLRMLPSTFSDLRSLKDLNVSRNNLSQLPAFRGSDIRLRRLDVSYNPLDGALNEASTFEVHPFEYDDSSLNYQERFSSTSSSQNSSFFSENRVPKLFEISMLRIVRCDTLLKLASEESLPKSIVSIMQRDIFKCYRCGKMNMLPAYNSTDILDYVDQVETLLTTGNYKCGMTFMKLLCRRCFDKMSS